ncbi:hypothetical protein SAMN05414139_03906 [Burkholderia sp. D7]|nr:hypothetical protein SAMN05414139_03906 [Burkholderia sp. D7]
MQSKVSHGFSENLPVTFGRGGVDALSPTTALDLLRSNSLECLTPVLELVDKWVAVIGRLTPRVNASAITVAA